MHGTRDMDELGLETPFQDSSEAEDFEALSWSGESPFANENESLTDAEGEQGESLDWLDYDSETARAPQACNCGAAQEAQEAQFDEAWSEAHDETEDEAPRCWREEEAPSEQFELAPSPEHLEFRTRVFERVLRDRKHRKPFPDIDRAKLDLVPRPSALPKGAEWRSVLTGKATAAAAGRLLEEAHQALREAQKQGDADALRTRFIYPNSGYRSAAEQKKLWLRYFSRKNGYYDLSADARSRLPGGPHSAAAVDYMVTPKGRGGFGIGGRIAPPGYSNHQNAIALDFTQQRSAAKYRIPNSTAPKDDADRKWKASWFHRWLNTKGAGGETNAARHGFSPIPTEAWHWEYRGQSAPNVGTPMNERGLENKAPPTVESSLLGGRLLDFKAKAHGGRVATFVPKAALGQAEVDVLFFVHGLLHVCKPPPEPLHSPVGLITQKAFRLGKLVDDSGLPIVVVAPFFNWARSAGRQPLANPTTLNALIQEVLDKVANSGSPVILRRLIVAGHSRAFGILDPLAAQAKSPEMEQGALARLAEVWALDTSYGKYKNVAAYTSWLANKPRLTLRVFYRPGSSTDGRDPKLPGRGHAFFSKRSPGRLEVVQCKERHCDVPVVRLPELLAGLKAKSSEAEHDEYLTYAADAEDAYGESSFEAFDESEDLQAMHDESNNLGEDEDFDQAALDYEDELERAFDSEWREDENEHDESGHDESGEWEAEDTFDEDEQENLQGDDEEEHGAWRELLEAESAKGAEPLPVPKRAPIAFAPEPAPGAFWPIRTTHAKARVISYLPSAGRIVGNTGRAFLAKRSGTRNGVRTRRWHLGIDLFCKRNDEVFACEAGTIVGYSFFYKARSGQKTYKILIAHEGSGVVANYGEVRPGSLKENGLAVGSTVRAGQRIGWVSDTDMIHFETYRPGTKDTTRWWADQPAPKAILNPTRYLLALAQRGQPPESGGPAGEEFEARDHESYWEQPEHEGSVLDMVRNAASGIMQDYSLKGLADGKLGNIPKAIRDDVLSGRDRDLWKVTNRVLWEKYPQLKGQKLDSQQPKHRALIEEYRRMVVHVRALLWLCRIVQLLDKYRGDLPRAFLLGWMAKESDGRVSTTTHLREMGYFQIHPAEGREILKLSDADFERIGTDREHSIEQGIRLVQAHRKNISSNHAVTDPSELLLRLTKTRHGLPGLLKRVLIALKKESKKPDWSEVSVRMRAAGDRGVVGNVEDTMHYASKLKPLVDLIPVT